MKEPIAFDFDGTITLRNEYPNCGVLRPGIAQCIQKLASEGFGIIIHTCRDFKHYDQAEAYAMMLEYLRDNGIVYDCINTNVNPTIRFNPTKPYAIIYVDDCALGWNPNWTGKDIYDMIHKKIDNKHINHLIANP